MKTEFQRYESIFAKMKPLTNGDKEKHKKKKKTKSKKGKTNDKH